MYCPKCGKTNSTDQNFCRSCGLQLEKVMQSLGEQLSSGTHAKTTAEKRRKLDKLIQIIAGGTVSIFVVSVIWGIIYSIIIVKGEVFAGLIFLIVILGLVLFALLALYRDSLLKRSTKRENEQPMLQANDTGKILSEGRLDPLPSVTDRTTELLRTEKKKGKTS